MRVLPTFAAAAMGAASASVSASTAAGVESAPIRRTSAESTPVVGSTNAMMRGRNSKGNNSVEIEVDSISHAAANDEDTLTDSTASTPATETSPGRREGWTPPSLEEHAHIQATKSQRMRERRQEVRELMTRVQPESEQLHRMTKEEMDQAWKYAEKEENADKEEHQWIRRAAWGNGGNSDPYSSGGVVDAGEYYDKWQQAYRMLGGFIDCTNTKDDGSHDSGDGNNNGGGDNAACSRWMMWAAYIDPNYSGNGYDEYFGDDPPGVLDCHSPGSSWKLIGVYRQEFYQYIEQISKHMWAIDDYEYIVALAGLAYMKEAEECVAMGYDESGNQLYASVQPLKQASFQMGLYTDEQCIEVSTTGYTYDDFAEGSDLDLGSKDATDDDEFHDEAYQYWQDTQEYTFTNLNEVYDDYRYCTSCVDYPTYQDGYFIGDDGKDDDDLINQCWKFYSHDSFNCDGDCVSMGASQGTISYITYNGRSFGELIDGQYSSSQATAEEVAAKLRYSRNERLKANLFLTVAGLIFVATFLAFAVARGSSKKKTSSSRSRSRRLLDNDYDKDNRSSRGKSTSGRSASRSRKDSEEKSRSSRSKSGRSKSRGASRSRSKSTAQSSSRRSSGYEAPVEKPKSTPKSERRSTATSSSQDRRKRSSSKKRSSSRKRTENF